jgi:hypothetical protein
MSSPKACVGIWHDWHARFVKDVHEEYIPVGKILVGNIQHSNVKTGKWCRCSPIHKWRQAVHCHVFLCKINTVHRRRLDHRVLDGSRSPVVSQVFPRFEQHPDHPSSLSPYTLWVTPHSASQGSRSAPKQSTKSRRPQYVEERTIAENHAKQQEENSRLNDEAKRGNRRWRQLQQQQSSMEQRERVNKTRSTVSKGVFIKAARQRRCGKLIDGLSIIGTDCWVWHSYLM